MNINMAADGGDDVFVYMGGEQELPDEITHAIIDPSINIVRTGAFYNRQELVSVIFHEGVEIIEAEAFHECIQLSGRIKLLGVREIENSAFDGCEDLSDVEFGDRLETIGVAAFADCRSLTSIKSLSVRNVQDWAFDTCEQLTDVEFGMNLETIGSNTFNDCRQLQRIAIPLKDNLFPIDTDVHRYTQFEDCDNLTTVDIVGAEGLHNTISSLFMESWRDEMNEELDRINRQLPNTPANEKTNAIRLWISSVMNRLEHYKAEHNRLLKEHMSNLALAVWKARFDDKEEDSAQNVQAKRATIDEESAREEKRITSGADIIIKNVLPFLKLG